LRCGFTKSTKMLPAGARGDKKENVSTKCDQLVPGRTKLRVFDQVNQNVTSRCEG
jgi:hypothetical protein